MPIDQPPLQPNTSIVRSPDDSKHAEEQLKLRRREEEERRKRIDADNRLKNSQTTLDPRK
jgi:hypothetical protein